MHSIDYPSSTHYDIFNFETIQNPFVTGGGSNNALILTKLEKLRIEKALYPFRTIDSQHETVFLKRN